MKIETECVREICEEANPIYPHSRPIYQTSTYVFETAEQGGARFSGQEEGFIYSRLGNPNTYEAAKKIAHLEGAEAGILTASGMAAISTTLLGLLSKGDEILVSDCIYGCSYQLMKETLPKFGIKVHFIDLTKEDKLINYINSDTKIIYLETPANPNMDIYDIKAISEIAHEYDIQLIVDNTFMTPYLQKPLQFGADIVIHSATKYLCGHGDVIAGVIVGKQDMIDKLKNPYLKDLGGISSPFDAWLLSRGLKTLAVRMEQHCKNAKQVALFLEQHDKVKKVYYPGLKSFERYELAQKQMKDSGGIISFELEGDLEDARRFINGLGLIKIAVSLGCVDSMIQHPASMTHSAMSKHDREAVGITDTLIRLSVGIESAEDIIQDIENSLNKGIHR